jgi:hypothetical protein
VSKTKAHFAQKAAFPQAQLGQRDLPSVAKESILNPPAPAPFEFAPRPTVQPYVTPDRIPGSGTGAQNAFASQRPLGFDPVQSFLSSLPELGSTALPQINMSLPPAPIQDAIPVPGAQPGVSPEDRRAQILREQFLPRIMGMLNN